MGGRDSAPAVRTAARTRYATFLTSVSHGAGGAVISRTTICGAPTRSAKPSDHPRVHVGHFWIGNAAIEDAARAGGEMILVRPETSGH